MKTFKVLTKEEQLNKLAVVIKDVTADTIDETLNVSDLEEDMLMEVEL